MTKYLFIYNKFIKLSIIKYLFFIILIIRTLITINSSSWINAWIGIEINLISFIPLILNKSKKKNSNSIIIYFIIQAGASSIIIIIIIIIKFQLNLNKINIIMNCLQLRLIIKLGSSPFHWWTPKVLINLNWLNCFIFLTWQKIAPLFLIYLTNFNLIIYLSTLLSNFIGAILGINQISIKLIIIYSSINHLGWIIITIILNKNIIFIYILIYSISILLMCIILNYSNFTHINQIFKNNNQNIIIKIISLIIFLSLRGLPPFLGFLPKILTLILIIINNLIIEIILFIIIAVISLSFYINPVISSLIFIKLNLKFNKKIYLIYKITIRIILINLLRIIIIIFNINIII